MLSSACKITNAMRANGSRDDARGSFMSSCSMSLSPPSGCQSFKIDSTSNPFFSLMARLRVPTSRFDAIGSTSRFEGVDGLEDLISFDLTSFFFVSFCLVSVFLSVGTWTISTSCEPCFWDFSFDNPLERTIQRSCSNALRTAKDDVSSDFFSEEAQLNPKLIAFAIFRRLSKSPASIPGGTRMRSLRVIFSFRLASLTSESSPLLGGTASEEDP
mmetsp:Transcript_20246/g.39162  ORF Transcript_20246/g.39162 Transcript_20246/m.39162 type:complete len:215 (-) Transcript_20246:473-1117(-)